MNTELEERFRELFSVSPGLDYNEIAAKLNHEFRLQLSKSAVSSMARRCGLSRRKAHSGGRKAGQPKPPKAAHVAKGGNTIGDRAARAQAQAAARAALAAEAAALGSTADGNAFDGSQVQGLRSFMQLNGTCCRWPYDCDDGRVRYCPNNKPDNPSTPYCATHSSMARGVARPYVRRY